MLSTFLLKRIHKLATEGVWGKEAPKHWPGLRFTLQKVDSNSPVFTEHLNSDLMTPSLNLLKQRVQEQHQP